MRAIRIHEFGGIDSMRLDEIPGRYPGQERCWSP